MRIFGDQMTNIGLHNRFSYNYPKLSSHENKKKDQVSFNGLLDNHVVTKFCKLKENEVASLLGINMVSMVLPQTWLDFHRNKQAGIETSVFQLGGILVNYLLYGALSTGITLFGLKALKILPGVNKNFDVSNKSLDFLGEHWKKAGNNTNPKEAIDTVVRNVFKNLSPKSGINLKESLKEGTPAFKDATEALINAIESRTNLNEIINPNAEKKLQRTVLDSIMDPIGKHLGACDKVLTEKVGDHHIEGSLEQLVRDTHKVCQEVFSKHSDEVGTKIEQLKSLNKFKFGITLAVVGALTFSIQHINRYLTKKRTGKDAFVGYSDADKGAKKVENKVEPKAVTPPQTAQETKLKKQVSFGGLFPDASILKAWIYPANITGRLTACRDKNERAEATIKCGVAFANFMFIPTLVANFAAWALSKNVKLPDVLKTYDRKISVDGKERQIGAIFNLSDKAFDKGNMGKVIDSLEQGPLGNFVSLLRLNELRTNSINFIKNHVPFLDKTRNWLIEVNDASTKSYREIGYFAENFVEAHKNEIIKKSVTPAEEKEILKNAAHEIKHHLESIKNGSILAGLAYACVTLGIIIPKGCAMWTDYKHKKELEKTGKAPTQVENPHKLFAKSLNANNIQSIQQSTVSQNSSNPDLDRAIDNFKSRNYPLL
ncbi:MAG: hypothetical protein WCK67_04405 [bacterium]